MVKCPDAFTGEELARALKLIYKINHIRDGVPPAVFLVNRDDFNLLLVCVDENEKPFLQLSCLRHTAMGIPIEPSPYVPMDVIYATY